MTNWKAALGLILALAGALVIVGCGEEIDPAYPCGQDALLHAQHVREVLRENIRLFKRQPGFRRAMEHFYRDEEGYWGDEYGIVLWVEEHVDQGTLPSEDRVPNQIEGVRIYFDVGAENYEFSLIEGVQYSKAEFQYADAVRTKHSDLLWGQPNQFGGIGIGTLHPGEPLSVDLGIGVTKKVRQSLLPPADRIPSCLDGIPVSIYETDSDSQ